MNNWKTAWSSGKGVTRARALFAETFGHDAHGVWASPGRVNLIGDHIDYNAGPCLPIALPHRTYVALSPRSDEVTRIITDMDGGQRWEGTLADISPGGVEGWVAYCAGPAWGLRRTGIRLSGFDAAVVSCVPVGAGLSSSAAVECAMALALTEVFDHPVGESDKTRAHLAECCVAAENEIAGAPTGGLDQAASLRSRDGHALLLDTSDGSARHIALPLTEHQLCVLVIDTRASHSLGDGQYGARRSSCEQAATILGLRTLREAADAITTREELDALLSCLPDDLLQRRVRHVVTEIWRVSEFTAALEAGDMNRVGRVMTGSHASLRDDFEVSVAELDTAVESALQAGALGARMTGGGFGGSVVALVDDAKIDTVAAKANKQARARGLPRPRIHLVTAGASGRRLA